jgi:DNA-binding NarL/FixJ family response regulator
MSDHDLPPISDMLDQLQSARARIESFDALAKIARTERQALVLGLRDSGMSFDAIAKHLGVTRQSVHHWSRHGE